MKFDNSSLLLYAVTDRSWLGGAALISQVEKCLKGGATFVQLREKNLPFDAFLAEAAELKGLCKKYGVPFVINDNADIAALCGADGVHVGQSDASVPEARALLGDKKIVGVSVQTAEQAVLAESQGADYLGAGAVFPTGTKGDAEMVSYDTLKNICAAVRIPVVAIGGISAHNIGALRGSGISGVAVVSAIFAAGDIEGASRALLKLSKEMVNDADQGRDF